VCAAIASTGFLFCFIFSPRFLEIRSFTSAREVFSLQREPPLVPVCPFQYPPLPAVLSEDSSHPQVFHEYTVKMLSIRYLRQLLIGLV